MAVPPPQTGPSVWLGSSLGPVHEHLSEMELELLEAAADRVLLASSRVAEGQLNIRAVDAEVEALRGTPLAQRVAELVEVLLNGRGFFVLQRWPVAVWGDAKSGAAFLVFSRLFGSLRRQNGLGHLLGHVKDLNMRSSDVTVRKYQTNERQFFHTDQPADAVGLLCLRQAKEGGDSAIVSCGQLYNDLLARRPDLLPLLLEPVPFDSRGEPGEEPFKLIKVFAFPEGRISVRHSRWNIDSSQRHADAPRLSAELIEALDLFSEVADEPGRAWTAHLEPGDLLFCSNHSVLHDRSAFVDYEDPALKRHLFRAWVDVDGAWAHDFERVEMFYTGVRNSVTWLPPAEVGVSRVAGA